MSGATRISASVRTVLTNPISAPPIRTATISSVWDSTPMPIASSTTAKTVSAPPSSGTVPVRARSRGATPTLKIASIAPQPKNT